MKFIILTKSIDGSKILINLKQVCSIFTHHTSENVTVIQFADEMNREYVLESVDSIINMIEKI